MSAPATDRPVDVHALPAAPNTPASFLSASFLRSATVVSSMARVVGGGGAVRL